MKIDLTRLNAILNRMGVKPTKHKFKGASLPPMDAAIDIALYKGIETSLEGIQTQDGLFVYKGRQIVIYIKDHTNNKLQGVSHNPKFGNKVHFYECRTIINMKSVGRFERYVQTTRRDNQYPIDVRRTDSIEVKLYPCQNCLKALDYKGFRSKFIFHITNITKFLDAFDLEEFFGVYSTFFTRKPDHTDSTAPYSGYVKNWDRVSRERRKLDGWICDDCGVNLSQSTHQQHLHVHHINGVKSDIHPKNLRSLCILCHAGQPYHGHMKPQADKYESLIKGLRREQRLD